MAAKQAILLNGVPICGRCYNNVRAERQKQQAAQTTATAPPAGFEVVSETSTTQELLAGPSSATGRTAPAPKPGGMPAAVPFDQAAVPIDQVFQPDPQAEAQPAPAPQAAPPPSTRESARRTGTLPPPQANDKDRTYLFGGLSAVASFILVILCYYLLFGSQTPNPETGKGASKGGTYSPQLPDVPPSTDPSKNGIPLPPPPPDAKTAKQWAQEFEDIRKIPDEEKDRKIEALKPFIEQCKDQLLVARARRLYEKIGGVALVPPIEPTETDLPNKEAGLKAEYFRGRDLKKEDLITRQTDIVVSLNTRNPMPPGVPKSEFSARWQGYLYVEKKGLYTIATRSDDGIRVDLGGQRIIGNWGDHAPTRDEKKLELETGYYKLKIEYYQGNGEGEVSLFWALKDGFDERLITSDNLFHEGG